MPASRFIWYELATSDMDAAARFYGDVVGWSVEPGPPNAGPPGQDYNRWVIDGSSFGGLMTVPPGAAAAGMRPGWYGYLAVPDVDACIAATEAAGGRVFMPGIDIEGIGRVAMIADPQGAAVYVMTPLWGDESQSFGRGLGHCGWNELRTSDAEAAIAFYQSQFGWTEAGRMPMGHQGGLGADYVMFGTGGEAVGGMMGGVSTHPAWLYYINVPDIVPARQRVEAAGGTLVQQPQEVPGGLWVFQARDPQGAPFALVGPKT